jgi:hypothetical protein
MDHSSRRTREFLESGEPLELSFVELVIAASECSEDESEIYELVDGLMESGRVSLEEGSDGRPDGGLRLLDAA